ncbi:MAG: phosphatidate cytidylyltransferase [Oscillospiraceae bacterium]|nr:phosphatidate cytidylyltransferase [Oscillospiraceae bacterium]
MKTRLISSAVGVAIALLVFWLHNTLLLPLILSAVICIILFELTRAIGGQKFGLAMTGVMLYGAASPVLEYLLCTVSREVQVFHTTAYELIGHVQSGLLTICALMLFIQFLVHHGKFRVEQLAFMGGAMFFVPWSITKLIDLNYYGDGKNGLFYLILALCGAWIADSGAYFCGVAFGKRKLCPNISPKKTVEGFIGGIISNAVIFLAIFWCYAVIRGMHFSPLDGLLAAILGIVCAPISVVGDLVFSVIKREKGIKDYGKIMPGHGGLTDRFDSVLFVVPMFYVFVHLFTIL